MNNHLIEIKKSVSFIFLPNRNGHPIPNGTGFFVSVKIEDDPTRIKPYFVTAKHVLQDEQGKYYPEIILRLNKKDGDSSYIKLETKNVDMGEHTDADVDIALFPCLPDVDIYDFKCIPSEIIANKQLMDEYKISEGDDVFFSGLFTSHIGQKRNQPIIRFGRVSLIPEEKIEWTEAGKKPKYRELYLLECQSFGGNSGSPVFFDLNPLRSPGTLTLGKQVFLAGIMTGSYLQGNEISQVESAATRLIALQNAGIAAVTPADKLYEILFSDLLIQKRKIIPSSK